MVSVQEECRDRIFECDCFKSIFFEAYKFIASEFKLVFQVLARFFDLDEVCFVVPNRPTESCHRFSFGGSIPRCDSFDSFVGDISAYILVWVLCGRFTVGTEDELSASSVFMIEFEDGMSGGSGSSEEVEDEGVFI